MGESEVTKSSLSVNKNEKNGSPRGLNPAISSFFLQLPHKFQNALKVNYLFCFSDASKATYSLVMRFDGYLSVLIIVTPQ